MTQPLRVVFNRLAALKPRTGVGSYIVNLLEALQELPGLVVHPFPSGASMHLARLAFRTHAATLPSPQALADRASSPSLAARCLAAARHLARVTGHAAFRTFFRHTCESRAFELYHEPNFLAWPSELPTVLTVHDLSVLTHPQWHPRDRVRAHEQHFRASIRRACHIVAVSEFTRQELIRTLGVPAQRVSTIHNGVRADLRPLPETLVRQLLFPLGLPQRYLLVVGTIEPRKNVLMLLRAYCSLPAGVRQLCPLILAGPWGWNAEPVADFFECVARHHNVRLLGYCPDALLPALYCGADALLYASHYEGFGLPVLEMLACGGAVLAADIPALREIASAGVQFIDPTDEPGWRQAIERIITDPDYLASLRGAGASHAASFTWDRAARQTLALYQRLARSQPPAAASR
jgi:alpha-1,3-rhamnosyl/mannosyltransferase